MENKVELMNLFWSFAGIIPGKGEISRFNFKDRVEAASKAGFKGIGILHADLEHILYNTSLKEMKKILDDNDIKHIELEFLTDWFIGSPKKLDSDKYKKSLLQASEVLQAKHIKVGDFNNTPCSMDCIVESFAALCKDAKNYGATIGFEIMKASMINNLKDAIIMVEAVGANNGGIVIDIAHQEMLEMTFDEIRRIPLKYLVNIELNDGLLIRNPKFNPMARTFCGEGEFDIKGFIKCIQNMGYTGPWALEIFNEDYIGLPLDTLCKRGFETTIAQFMD